MVVRSKFYLEDAKQVHKVQHLDLIFSDDHIEQNFLLQILHLYYTKLLISFTDVPEFMLCL